MGLDSARIYVGQLDTSKVGRFITASVDRFSVATFEAVARYGATLGAWECTVKQCGSGTPSDFPTAIKFTASILNLPAKDVSGVGQVVFTNTVAGSGVVDIYIEAKA